MFADWDCLVAVGDDLQDHHYLRVARQHLENGVDGRDSRWVAKQKIALRLRVRHLELGEGHV
jgi:hypothetical protein